jgi:hypothetical protein
MRVFGDDCGQFCTQTANLYESHPPVKRIVPGHSPERGQVSASRCRLQRHRERGRDCLGKRATENSELELKYSFQCDTALFQVWWARGDSSPGPRDY